MTTHPSEGRQKGQGYLPLGCGVTEDLDSDGARHTG